MLMTPFSAFAAGLAFILYLVLGWHIFLHWRARAVAASRIARCEQLGLALALFLHVLTLRAPESHWISLGLGQSVSLMMWLAALIYWIMRFFHRIEGLQPVLMSCTGLALLLGVMLPPSAVSYDLDNPALALHIFTALFAYGLIALSAMMALLMVLVETLLHRKQGLRLVQTLPPLLTLERLLFMTLWSGFILLTLTLSSGVVFSEQIFGRAFSLTHKNILSLLAWVIFAALLYGRVRHGWRGRLAARWTLGGTVALLLGYIGSKIVLEFILIK